MNLHPMDGVNVLALHAVDPTELAEYAAQPQCGVRNARNLPCTLPPNHAPWVPHVAQLVTLAVVDTWRTVQ